MFAFGLTLPVAALATVVNAQVLTTYWIQPPQPGSVVTYSDNIILSLGSQLHLEWVTFLSEYSIWLWQQNLSYGAAATGNPVFTKNSAQPETGETTWIVDAQTFDLNESNVFFFALGPNVTLQGSFTSHYFNLSAVSVPSTTTSLLSSTTTATTSSNSPSSAVSTSSSVPSGAVMSSTDHESEKIGLGVGVGIGLPLVAAILGCIIWKAARNRTNRHVQHDTEPVLKPPRWAGASIDKSHVAELSADASRTRVAHTEYTGSEPHELSDR